jgi:hypothetical protein
LGRGRDKGLLSSGRGSGPRWRMATSGRTGLSDSGARWDKVWLCSKAVLADAPVDLPGARGS